MICGFTWERDRERERQRERLGRESSSWFGSEEGRKEEMGMDPRQLVAGVLTITMFVMLGNMIHREHFREYTPPLLQVWFLHLSHPLYILSSYRFLLNLQSFLLTFTCLSLYVYTHLLLVHKDYTFEWINKDQFLWSPHYWIYNWNCSRCASFAFQYDPLLCVCVCVCESVSCGVAYLFITTMFHLIQDLSIYMAGLLICHC